MEQELTTLELNETWTMVDLPPKKRMIYHKWIYKDKFKIGGMIEQAKAYLVANGFTQQEGIDFHDTFLPVAKLTFIRYLLVMTATRG